MTALRPHGHYRTYRRGCRCTECRNANRLYQQAGNQRRRSDPVLADLAGHGRPNTYSNYGCRCEACREANTAAGRQRRARAKERAA